MISSKRIAKRSIVGTRVSTMFSNGIFYPGTIRGIVPRPAAPTGEVLYQVLGDDGAVREVPSNMIVGPGFQSVANTHLKFNQLVFTTLNGREIQAVVQKHRKPTNEVLLRSADDVETNFKRKLDDVRLLESRKSARIGYHGTDYLKLADMCPEAKKRPVSTNIEVPSAKTQKVQQEAEPPMDDVMAAMVLTSLLGSPHVNTERNHSGDSMLTTGPMSPASSLSSGYGNVSPSPSPSTNGHFNWDICRSTPSPASSNSDMESLPCLPPPCSTARGSLPTSSALFSSSLDEGIDVSGGSLPFSMEDTLPCSPTKKFKPSIKTSYKCTWQGCGKTLSTVQGIERHIRTIHLRKKEGEEYSDHEEEFYYDEIDTTVESVSDTLANMFTSSPPPTNSFNFNQLRLPHPHPDTAIPDTTIPDTKPMDIAPLSPALESEHRARSLSTSSCSSLDQSAPAPTVGSVPNQAITMMASPVSIPTTTSQFSWCSVSPTAPTSFSFPSTSTQPSQTSNIQRIRHKSVGSHHGAAGQPKIRSEGKKCRKVYGMENRDMWCTQCRWKKACVRFT